MMYLNEILYLSIKIKIVTWKLLGHNYVIHKWDTIDSRSGMRFKLNDKQDAKEKKNNDNNNDEVGKDKYGNCLFDVILVIDISLNIIQLLKRYRIN